MRALTTYTSSLFCLTLLFLLSLSMFPAVSAQAGPPPADPVSVQMVDVDGHSVRVQVLGFEQREEGEPVVVFEAGAGNPLEVWGLVLPHMAESAPVVAYDRAGLGHSEWDDEIPTPQHVAQRLHSVLDQIGAGSPYLLVVYSWGGTLIRYYAGIYVNSPYHGEIVKAQNRLHIHLPGAPSLFPLIPVSDTRFFVGVIPQPIQIQVIKQDENTVTAVEITQEGFEGIFVRKT